MNKYIVFFCVLVTMGTSVSGQYRITTIAGNGTQGFSGDGGAAVSAELNQPMGLAIDAAGNLYFSDHGNNCIRKISTTGTISTIAGTPLSAGLGGDGGAANAAQLNAPVYVATDGSGNLFISDLGNDRVRKVNTAGVISTYAGIGDITADYTAFYDVMIYEDINAGGLGSSIYNVGDGGPATAGLIDHPWGLAVDGSGNLIIADLLSERIRKVNTSGIISTIAGTGYGGFTGDGGNATAAEIYYAQNLCMDASGNIYLADNRNHRIRKINTSGIISTIAGNGIQGSTGDGGAALAAELYGPSSIGIDASGNIFLDDNYTVRMINPAGIITTIAGTGTAGFSGDNGPATDAQLNGAGYFVFDGSGNIYMNDIANQRIRKLSSCTPPTLAAITGTGNVCVGIPAPFLDATSGGTWQSSDNTIATVGTTGNVTGVAPGSLTISYSINTGCGATVTSAVTVNPIPDAGTITGATLVAPGSTTPLFDTNPGGTWSSSDNTKATVDGGGLVTGVSAGAVSINYTITDLCGTSGASKSMTVLNDHAPVLVHGNNPNVTICANYGSWSLMNNLQVSDLDAGQTLTWNLNLPPTNGTVNASYVTASTGGVVTPAGLFYQPNAGFTGTDNFSVIVSDGILTTVANITVYVLPVPAIPIVSGPSNVCTGGTINLIGLPAGGTWNHFSANISISSTGTVTGLHQGTTFARYISPANSYGCTSSADFPVTVITPLSTPNSGPTSMCLGGTVLLTNPTAGGTWSTSDPTYATVSSSGLVTGVAYGGCGIIYTIINACGTQTEVTLVTVPTPQHPVAIHGSSSAICPGGVVTLDDATVGGVWSSATPALASVSGGRVVGIAAGNAIISYTLTNSCGDHGAATRTVTVSPLPPASPAVTGPAILCVGTVTTLTGSPAGGTWLRINGDETVYADGSVLPANTGSGTIYYGFHNSCGSSTAVYHFTNGTAPQLDPVTGVATFAAGSTSSYADATAGGTWSSDFPALATISSTGLLTAVNSGTEVIRYSTTNTCGTSAVTKNITITPHTGARGVDSTTTSTQSSWDEIKVYPNPNSGYFTVEVPATTAITTALVLDMTGKQISSKTSSETTIDFNLADLPRGIYIMNIMCGDKTYSKKIEVQ